MKGFQDCFGVSYRYCAYHSIVQICKLAHKSCSGRVLSILEGGYGVPCCRLPSNIFDPEVAEKRSEIMSTQDRDAHSDPKVPVDEKLDADNKKTSHTKAPVDGASPDSATNGSEAENSMKVSAETVSSTTLLAAKPEPPVAAKPEPPLKPLEILNLGDDLPPNMKDDMPYALMKRLDKCHAEGFVNCVKEHIAALAKCNLRK